MSFFRASVRRQRWRDGDGVLVAAGTYEEQVTVAKSLTLRGAQAGIDAVSRSGPEAIVQHPLGALVVVSCGSQVVVDGFTLAGVFDPAGKWAGRWITSGVSCSPAHEIRVENNIVRDNIWGLWINGGTATVRHNLFIDNAEMPGVSQGVHSDSPAEQLLVEQNDFEGHLDDSIVVNGPTSVAMETPTAFARTPGATPSREAIATSSGGTAATGWPAQRIGASPPTGATPCRSARPTARRPACASRTGRRSPSHTQTGRAPMRQAGWSATRSAISA